MHMHSLAEDVPQAITNVLSTHKWRARKQLIDSVFAEDVQFWHLFHDCKNRRELFGVYQMWGAYNFWIDVKYQRVIPDKQRLQVVVDLEETTRVWWAPHTWILIPLRLNLNVILDLQEEANGELIFTRQADHIFWVESLLEINPILTLWVGPAFMKYIRPIAGSIYAQIGNAIYARISDAPGHAKPIKAQEVGFANMETDLQKAISVAYGGNAFARWNMSQSMYADDAEFIHTFFTVNGKHNIFGAHNLWISLMRKSEAKIQRLVCAESQDLVLVDLEQRYWPYLWWPYLWWPEWAPLAIWVHVILTLEDAHTIKAGKVIVKHEDHVLWVESLLLRNLGPFSRFYDHTIRRLIGIFFSVVGNSIYTLLLHLSNLRTLFMQKLSWTT
ncbi:hypothetical protein ABBQ32_003837 [Trebouxia sp. C0010 RCD-2024]